MVVNKSQLYLPSSKIVKKWIAKSKTGGVKKDTLGRDIHANEILFRSDPDSGLQRDQNRASERAVALYPEKSQELFPAVVSADYYFAVFLDVGRELLVYYCDLLHPQRQPLLLHRRKPSQKVRQDHVPTEPLQQPDPPIASDLSPVPHSLRVHEVRYQSQHAKKRKIEVRRAESLDFEQRLDLFQGEAPHFYEVFEDGK